MRWNVMETEQDSDYDWLSTTGGRYNQATGAKIMKRVIVKSRVGADGVLHVNVPIGAADANRDVRVTIESEIDRLIKRIVKKFQPEKIILFGSRARGDAGPDSDVDLLIVMDVAGSKLKKRLEIREELGACCLPLDVIVTTPEDFAWRKDVVGTIEWPAAREGKVLYGRT